MQESFKLFRFNLDEKSWKYLFKTRCQWDSKVGKIAHVGDEGIETGN
jgi:hypothetical protein